MDRSRRWETEAIRASGRGRTSPPQPTGKRAPSTRRRAADWVTLREAESATGIPLNTLRKWVRKDAIASYLESDGELTLRMVDLEDIKKRAHELGRDLQVDERPTNEDRRPVEPETASKVGAAKVGDQGSPQDTDGVGRENRAIPEDTMLVPIDAWNKMLAQLGNLHEAGQQLADARERAAKAETEAAFLRERLREIRDSRPTDHAEPTPIADETATSRDEPESGPDTAPNPVDTTTYWRYLTSGWRNRQRRAR